MVEELKQSPVVLHNWENKYFCQKILEFLKQTTREETFYRVSSGNAEVTEEKSVDTWKKKLLLCKQRTTGKYTEKF